MNTTPQEPEGNKKPDDKAQDATQSDARTPEAVQYDNTLDLSGSQDDVNDNVIKDIIKKAAKDAASGKPNRWNTDRKGWDPLEK